MEKFTPEEHRLTNEIEATDKGLDNQSFFDASENKKQASNFAKFIMNRMMRME